jgi:hypothetical protein
VGQRGALLLPIVNGRGRIRLGDSSWSVTGPDLPAGMSVEVTGIEGTVPASAPAGRGAPRSEVAAGRGCDRPEGSPA